MKNTPELFCYFCSRHKRRVTFPFRRSDIAKANLPDLLLKIEQRALMTHVRRELCLHKGLLVICNLSGARRDTTNFLPSASVSLLHIRNFHARSHTRSTRMCHATVAAQASLSLSLSGLEKSLPLRKMIWAGIGSKELLDPRSRALEVLSEEVWAV